MLDVTAFAALIKRKRGEARLTQETLAQDVFGDSGRKADISRLENARVPNPQEATVQKICTALNISAAEMEPIRQSRLSAAQLDQIPTLSREELENLANRFEIEGVFDRTDEDLRQLLTKKAEEYRALKNEVDAIPDNMKRLANLKAAAQDAVERVDLDEVEHLMGMVHATELEEAAKSAEIRADNALLRGNVAQAFVLFSSAADSFAPVDPIEPARRRIQGSHRGFPALYFYGLRYGGDGLSKAAELVRTALSTELRLKDDVLWAAGQNNLAVALKNQGTRTDGIRGTDLLAEAVVAYRAALEVRTQENHPLDWAKTQSNLGLVLRFQGTRSDQAKALKLLDDAILAYSSALKVHTRSELPDDWAKTLTNLGIALKDKAIRSADKIGKTLLVQAVETYREALEVYTRDTQPEPWAGTQNHLGTALRESGLRTPGPVGLQLLAEARNAYLSALEVRSQANHPVDWAMTQENIAITQTAIANHDTCTDPKSALTEALAAIDAALTVFDPEHMSYNYTKATKLRTGILAQLDALSQ